jgi:hypothetical protein
LDAGNRIPPSNSHLSIVPKCVLDVSHYADTIRLFEIDEDDSMNDTYICLSHCWGRQEHFKLTTGTLEEMKEGLKTSRLAQNFQDAVMMTRMLGIRYLWIDALCILQILK